jgi:hypothetical protein
VLPAQLTSRFRWVAYQIVHFRRAEVPRIHLDQDPPGARLDAALGLALALPFRPVQAKALSTNSLTEWASPVARHSHLAWAAVG